MTDTPFPGQVLLKHVGEQLGMVALVGLAVMATVLLSIFAHCFGRLARHRPV